jgi:hypothetical protein
MPRRILGAFLALLAVGAPARAQYIGAGSTMQGDYLRGVGIAAYGMGIYNERTAVANQINTETFIRWNEYVDAVMRTEAREAYERRAARRAHYDELHKRRRENPNDLEVLKGDALNDVLKQLLDPQISESSFRYAEVALPVDLVRQIPFMLAEKNVKFSISRLVLKGKAKWPVAFQDPRFASYIRSYDTALDNALEQAIDGKMTKQAIAAVEAAVDALWRKLNAEFPPSQDKRYLEAKERLEELGRSVELLKIHQVEVAIGEIDQYSGTTVNDLRLFMQRHNLLFAPARTQDERSLYPKLHASLVEQRDKLKGAIEPKN